MRTKFLKKKFKRVIKNYRFNSLHSYHANELPIEIRDKLLTREKHLKELYEKLNIHVSKQTSRTCKICDNILTDKQKVYCSQKCKDEGLKIYQSRHIPGTLHIVRFCEICGEPFVTTKADLTLYTGRICKKNSCKKVLMTEEVMNKTKHYECIFCQTEFYTMYPSLFCSDSCRYAYAYFCNGIFDDYLIDFKKSHKIKSSTNESSTNESIINKSIINESTINNESSTNESLYKTYTQQNIIIYSDIKGDNTDLTSYNRINPYEYHDIRVKSFHKPIIDDSTYQHDTYINTRRIKINVPNHVNNDLKNEIINSWINE